MKDVLHNTYLSKLF